MGVKTKIRFFFEMFFQTAFGTFLTAQSNKSRTQSEKNHAVRNKPNAVGKKRSPLLKVAVKGTHQCDFLNF